MIEINLHGAGPAEVLYFGDGDDTEVSPMASVDIVAHELGHGISDSFIDWENVNEQNAIEEGMSDIWGVIMEQNINPQSIWKMGDRFSLLKSCSRNIETPSDPNAKYQLFTNYNDPNFFTQGNQYTRSGVFTHWFYLLAEGGTCNGVTVSGIGIANAENLIAEAVFGSYLSNTTTFPNLRTCMVVAAKQIFSEINAGRVETAWSAVGVPEQAEIDPSFNVPVPNIVLLLR